jgi:hypothetical protein
MISGGGEKNLDKNILKKIIIEGVGKKIKKKYIYICSDVQNIVKRHP